MDRYYIYVYITYSTTIIIIIWWTNNTINVYVDGCVHTDRYLKSGRRSQHWQDPTNASSLEKAKLSKPMATATVVIVRLGTSIYNCAYVNIAIECMSIGWEGRTKSCSTVLVLMVWVVMTIVTIMSVTVYAMHALPHGIECPVAMASSAHVSFARGPTPVETYSIVFCRSSICVGVRSSLMRLNLVCMCMCVYIYIYIYIYCCHCNIVRWCNQLEPRAWATSAHLRCLNEPLCS